MSGGSESCWEYLGYRNKDGYGRLTRDGEQVGAHRVALELSKGDIPHGMVVRHTCDHPPCCNPSHLLTGTMADNNTDMIERGRAVVLRGSSQGTAKMTEQEVFDARCEYVRGSSTHGHVPLASRYGVSPAAMRQALAGGSWGHVPFPVGYEFHEQ